ncbi:transcriptional regulator [Roseobacter cerasinus]|uniref:Transcriptional regulator n=1 Tax=Roseobacter cerasinus TaxID=2602289 RepID=A0A640VR89_9RHOB|nr:LacI family DNA-binding transcriptional regulator [Roseobacter cerasinus]GFE50733.1 transcriptional regulator [Roseobacter cerasinus]
MDQKKADIIAVAKAARVSPSTVSRSFNHPDLVKATTRKRIDAAVRRLGYIRNRAAQTIHGIRSGTVGLIVPTVDHAIFAELIQSFAGAIEELGFTILLASHGYDLQREYALTRKMLEHRVDGVALVGIDHEEETLSLLQNQNTPTVLLWNYTPDTLFPCVGSDNDGAGRLVGSHVAGLGHRQIATLFPPLAGNDRAAQRHLGVEKALDEHGVTIPDHLRLETPYSVASAKAAVTDILGLPQRPTAILCGNDVLAWGALHAISKLGLRVPHDITVTGIGDFKGSREFEPALTTVRIPARQIGAKAAALIAGNIVTPETPGDGELIVPELLVRSTCGRSNNSACL